jgi:hypothetical protein
MHKDDKIHPPLMNSASSTSITTTAPARRWRPASVAILFIAWAILQIGGLFTPGLLDDVDSVYIQIAREMLQRHDFVTPTIDGIRFFDKPPLMYWMAAGSMHLFGVHDWAARLPLALGPSPFSLPSTPSATASSPPSPPPPTPTAAALYSALAHRHLRRPLSLHPLLHPRHRRRPLDDARRPSPSSSPLTASIPPIRQMLSS